MHFDLVVIGAGSGGLAAAKRAAKYGARVAICEGDRVGGTCVIYGCVPKKLMVYASQFSDLIQESQGYGWDISGSFSWERLCQARNAVVDRLNSRHIDLLKQSGVTLYQGRASFVDAHHVRVNDTVLSADRILIASGGEPIRPDIPGAELGLVSQDIFSLPQLPNRLLIVGGGYIASEFAGCFHGYGSQVEMLIRSEHLLNGFDHECRVHVEDEMISRGILLHRHKELVSLSKVSSGIEAVFSDGQLHLYEQVLFATGRRPKLSSLTLDSIGLSPQSGAISINADYETGVSGVYALGDCTDRYNLTPVAIADGRCFADHVFGKRSQDVSCYAIPTAVFSNPEFATCGFTESDAVSQYSRDGVVVHRASFRTLYHSMTGSPHKVLLKMVLEKSSDTVLGVHMVGSGAADIIQSLAIAIQMGAKKSDFDRTMALHPTVAEEFVTL